MRTSQLHIQFRQHRQTGKLAIVDDTPQLSTAHNKQLIQWLHDVAVQKLGVKLFFDVMESVPDVEMDVRKPTVYRPIRFQAHRMQAVIPFKDGHKETLYFMMAATEDWKIQIVGNRVSPDNWRPIPWNQSPGKELSQVGGVSEVIQ